MKTINDLITHLAQIRAKEGGDLLLVDPDGGEVSNLQELCSVGEGNLYISGGVSRVKSAEPPTEAIIEEVENGPDKEARKETTKKRFGRNRNK